VFGLFEGLRLGAQVTPTAPGKAMRASMQTAVLSGLAGTVLVGVGFSLLSVIASGSLVVGLRECLVFVLGGALGAGMIYALGSRLGTGRRTALIAAGAALVVVGSSALPLLGPHVTAVLARLATNAAGGVILGLSIGLGRGGSACLRHGAIRRLLEGRGVVPRDYVAFLDYAAGRILLSRRGGGYQFFHRSLLEYFADLERPA
jgi:hypothetical protein